MERRRFAHLLAGMSVVVHAACRHEGATPGPSPQSVSGTISLNHGHEVVITGERLIAGDGYRLDITGRSTHSHFVELTADDVRRIRAGERVTRNSSDGFDDKHDHLVTSN